MELKIGDTIYNKVNKTVWEVLSVQMLHDIGYEAIPIGDRGECDSGLCDLQMDDVK